MTRAHNLEDLARHFRVEGAFRSATPHGSGHINDSYCVSFDKGGSTHRYLLQRLNGNLFRDPGLLMENVQRVTSHLTTKLAGESDIDRRVLTLVPLHDGRTWHREADGSCWRMFQFIENARTFDRVESTDQAFETARAVGSFQQLLADLPAPGLHKTIPAFHDTPKRFLDLERAIEADSLNRAALAASEIAFALSLRSISSVLLDADLPERVTHNDAKLNNIMFDASTSQALCVVDLDTVMPGLALYDFGDMVRSISSPAQEDEQDLSRVTMHLSLFEALVRGYLSTARAFLTSAERNYLPFSGKLIAFEQGIRFLTDYLEGDIYYKFKHPSQNLDRCRTQFKLVQSIELQEEEMHRIVASI